MNDLQRRRFERALRVRDFAVEHSSSTPAGKATQAVTRIGQLIEQINALGASQSTHTRNSRAGTSGKGAARAELRALLSAIARTARTISLDDPSFAALFRLPSGNPGDITMLDTARSFQTAATPLKPRFVEYGLSDDFLTTLAAKIGAFEESASQQNTGANARAADRVAIVSALKELDAEIARLDAVLRNKFADDESMLAAWETASRLERAPRKPKTSAPPPAT
jgi:hypothetical protein